MPACGGETSGARTAKRLPSRSLRVGLRPSISRWLATAVAIGEDPNMKSAWVILTTGGRPKELTRAIDSILSQNDDAQVVLVANGVDPAEVDPGTSAVTVVASPENLGVPGGRALGAASAHADIVLFLDDDAAVVTPGLEASVLDAFTSEPSLAVVSFRIIDETGVTIRRHVPRIGSGSAERSGPVATFLGGACAVRWAACERVGGYWADLHYGHEELDLSWRLIDDGQLIEYHADLAVFHPATTISRHEYGWRLTGRNRVLIARRDLPLPIAVIHVAMWAVLGIVRADDLRRRRAYVTGLLAGFRYPVERHPISWSAVRRLAALGRPPLV